MLVLSLGVDATKYSVLSTFMAKTTHFLVLGDNRAKEDWEMCLVPYSTAIVGKDKASAVCDEVTAAGTAALTPEKVDVEDEEEDLCNAQFSLAYGTRVLLHQVCRLSYWLLCLCLRVVLFFCCFVVLFFCCFVTMLIHFFSSNLSIVTFFLLTDSLQSEDWS